MGVEPVAKIGCESFYDTRAVLENRLQHQSGKQQPGAVQVLLVGLLLAGCAGRGGVILGSCWPA